MDVTPKGILVKAKALISEEKHWTQGSYGRNAKGIPVAKNQLKNAVCFCAVGAIIRANQLLRQDDTLKHAPYDVYRGWKFPSSLTGFNDINTHTEVLALFDDMINAA